MQAWLPLRNGILLYIRKNDFSLICTVKIVAVKMLILWLMLPRILDGYLKIKRFFCVVYISIGALVIWGCAFKLTGVSRIESVLCVLAIATPLDFFAQGNCYTFLETLGIWKLFRYVYKFFFDFCTIYRPEQNEVIKPFFLDLYSSGQDTMLKFCTLTNTLKGYRSKKKISRWQPLCVFYRP